MLPGAVTSMIADAMFWLAGEMLEADTARVNSPVASNK